MEKRLSTNIVPPSGPLDAKILFIGDAPGVEEDRHLRPFIGTAGGMLNRCLQDRGILRNECLLNNVFAQMPPKGDLGYYFTDKKNRTKLTWEGQEHVDRLEDWLTLLKKNPVRPNIIVTLGRTATYILTGKKRLNKWRGSLLPCILVPGYKVYPTFHPFQVNKLLNEQREAIQGEKKKLQQNILPVFLIDLLRIKEQAEFPEIRYPERNFKIGKSYGEIILGLQDILQKEPKYLSVDIETLRNKKSMEGPILWCIGFSESPDKALVVPFLLSRKFAFPIEQEAEILILISKIFLNPNIQKIFQGGIYDLSVLGRYYHLRVANGTYEDTMWCHHSSYPYIKKGLDMLTSIYTWEPYYKDEGKVHLGKRSGDMAEFRYNAKDCCVTREIFPIVRRDAHELETWEGYLAVTERIPSLLAMMLRGVRIDENRKDELGKEFQARAVKAQQAVDDLRGEPVNLSSPPQLKKLLYYDLGLPEQINFKTKKVTTDKDALQKLKRKYPNEPILQHIIDHRKFSKLASTYTEMQVDPDGRIHTSYSIVSTWRLSSSESPFGSGGNLQNIPNSRTDEGTAIRSLFVPDPEKILIASDLSQAEARVVAWEAKDIPKMEAFLDPDKDVHWENALVIFFNSRIPYNAKETIHSPIANLTKEMKFFRNLGKTCVHAANYDMGPSMLRTILAREGVIFPMATCTRLLDTYKANNPMLGEWKRKIREKIKADRTLISSYGRKRQFMGRLDDNLFRSAYAFSPQNTVGEIVCDGIKNIHTDLEKFEILLNVHDEVVGQCLPEDKDFLIPEIKKRMEISLDIEGRILTIPAEFKVGPSWGELKEVEV